MQVRRPFKRAKQVSLTSSPAPFTSPNSQVRTLIRSASRLLPILIPTAAFGLYWISSFLLEARNGTLHFHADTWLYSELAKEDLFSRIAPDTQLARIFRFHPVTVVMAAAWMKILNPLTVWITPLHLLKGMFAAVGAVGVWAAMSAFAAVVPRRYVALWGIIYASSLGVWYFSSIEESKIVTATLSALYIATYLHLRKRWTVRGAALLTTILLVACLNEITAGFLVAIPVVDTLVQRGWDIRNSWWIALHGLAGPVALAILESIIRGWSAVTGTHPEGATHFSMLLWYAEQNDTSLRALSKFIIKWVFFTIAAPERHADHWANFSINFGGDFEPFLSNYLSSPLTIGLAAMFVVMLVASVLPHNSVDRTSGSKSILLALLAYALLRGTFFFFFNSKECLLFSPSAALAHMLLLGIPFAASGFPAKGALLLLFGALLFLTNGAFIIG